MSGPSPETAGLVEPLRSRWSPSVFDAQHVMGDVEIALLLDAARWAPSQGNGQPWSYVVAPRGSSAHGVLVEHLSRGNTGWVPRASVVLLGAVQVAADPADPEGPTGRGPRSVDFARYDLGQSAAHLTLQAHGMGLHAHQFAGYDRAAVALALGVPAYVELMAGIAVGRLGDPTDPGVDPRDVERQSRPRVRRTLAEVAHGDRWGDRWGESWSAGGDHLT